MYGLTNWNTPLQIGTYSMPILLLYVFTINKGSVLSRWVQSWIVCETRIFTMDHMNYQPPIPRIWRTPKQTSGMIIKLKWKRYQGGLQTNNGKKRHKQVRWESELVRDRSVTCWGMAHIFVSFFLNKTLWSLTLDKEKEVLKTLHTGRKKRRQSQRVNCIRDLQSSQRALG